MGNCFCKGLGVAAEEKAAVIKVATPTGGVMELQTPIKAETITNEFPGYAIFSAPHRNISPPLLHHEQLSGGQSYYLLPIRQQDDNDDDDDQLVDMMPYRMSVDHNQQGSSTPSKSWQSAVPDDHQQVSTGRYKHSSTGGSRGVWKVRLAINSDQLADILSQEGRTEALIESVRTVAKCASGVPSPARSEHHS